MSPWGRLPGSAGGANSNKPLAARLIRRLFLFVSCSSELPGLTASLDKLCYHHGGASLPADKPHAFVYFITIHNSTEHTVTLLGRKWVVIHADGTRLVIDAYSPPEASEGVGAELRQIVESIHVER